MNQERQLINDAKDALRSMQSFGLASEGYKKAVDELNREVGKLNKIIKSWYIGICINAGKNVGNGYRQAKLRKK